MPGHGAQLWSSAKGDRYYLVPDGASLPPGDVVIRRAGGVELHVEPTALAPFEISEEQAVRWTKASLPEVLAELRASLDETIADARAHLAEERRTPVAPETTVTPNAVPALLDLLRSLPRIVGQSISGDEERVAAARASLADLQRRLDEGGVPLDERFTGFADRLAGLRKDAEARRPPAERPDDPQRAEEPSREPPDDSEPGPSR